MISDAPIRAQALAPGRSFLVQAPAGSGKTELLVQRFLRLLSVVDAPEEVVALTFTRKAAAEMRQRINTALLAADANEVPQSEHARKTAELARAALARDAECGWQLCTHPNRLRVQTLDALCTSITRQMPLLSAFGAQPGVHDDARELYDEAAERTLAELERGDHWSLAIERLLTHLNNDLGRLAQLLGDMLKTRDQWLRFVANRHDGRRQRENLEAALASLITAALEAAADVLPAEHNAELMALASFAVKNLPEAQAQTSPLASLRGLTDLPDASSANLEQWQGLSELLLTKDGEWRKQANKNFGFPAQGAGRDASEKSLFKRMKEAHATLLQDYADVPGLLEVLAAIPDLPPAQYSAAQWQVLEALFELLHLAAANLQIVFSDRATVDFIEMAARAQRALGEPQAPTDLALALDYRISHLLVDEFQDTSLTQFTLLEKLVAGWLPGDGRSLFLVGDPMQSIYRFRQAEVGLYLQVRDHGLGPIALEFCQLTANFRSSPAVIDWVNQVFPSVMPPAWAEDAAAGAISYTAAEAARETKQGGVSLHPFAGKNLTAEAERIVELVSDLRQRRPEASIAILVRSRRHVAHLLPLLKASDLFFQSVEIEALGERPVIQDLLALTRALLHQADRLSWLAVLRSPYCGLSLADLHAVASHARQQSIFESLQAPELQHALSEHGRASLARIMPVLAVSLAERGRRALRRWVQGTWLALGGAAAADAGAQVDAQVYFQLLEQLDEGGDLSDFARLAKKVEELYAPVDARAPANLQIMTIHRAKGLEFDAVIVPSLGRPPAGRSQPLLFWLELPAESANETGADDAELLLAPIAATGKKDEPIYNHLKSLDQVKTRYEQARLLYVAATRARDELHLLGHVALKDDAPGVPAAGSLLERLWPGVAGEFFDKLGTVETVEEDEPGEQASPLLRRLPASWQAPEASAAVAPGGKLWQQAAAELPADVEVEYLWAGPEVRHVGTVVHEFLQRISQDGPEAWDIDRLNSMAPQIATRLTTLGVARPHTGEVVERVLEAVNKTLADERGRWLLQSHSEAVSEYPLTGLHGGELVNVIIDRSFVDDSGQRWIIDYKTGRHEGADIERFLDREQQRYAPQLERYADLMARIDSRPIRLGLYFPMLGGWREWPAARAWP